MASAPRPAQPLECAPARSGQAALDPAPATHARARRPPPDRGRRPADARRLARRPRRRQRQRQVEPVRAAARRAARRDRRLRGAARTGASPPSARRRRRCQQPAIEFVLDGDAELRAIEAAIAGGRRTRTTDTRWRSCTRGSKRIDGYAARARAAAMLAGLGFATRDLERPVADFSGGWRMRLNLGARAAEPRRPAAARRADQPPRPRRRRLARALARAATAARCCSSRTTATSSTAASRTSRTSRRGG